VDELFYWPLALAWLLVVTAAGTTLLPGARRLAVAT